MVLTFNKEKRTMKQRLTIWILALTLVGAFGLIGCDKKEETGAEKVKQDVSEMVEEGVNATEHGVQAVGEKVEEAAEAVKGEHN
jgi:ribulose-5-phosphate 4-epimerase/fuculose-1-phosphate aldolase